MADFFDYKDSEIYTPAERDITFQNQVPFFTAKDVAIAQKDASSNITSMTDMAIVSAAEDMFLEDGNKFMTDILVKDKKHQQARVRSALEFSRPDEYTWNYTAAVMMHQIITDPYGIAIAAASGFGVAALGRLGATAAPSLAETLTATAVRRIGVGAAEGVLPEAVEMEVEVALLRKEAQMLGSSFTDQDAANVRTAHLAFGAIIGGITGVFGGQVKRVRNVEADITVGAAEIGRAHV